MKSQVSDHNYIIQLTPDSPEIRVHVDNLKAHYGRPPPAWAGEEGRPPRGPSAPPDPPGDAEGDELEDGTPLSENRVSDIDETSEDGENSTGADDSQGTSSSDEPAGRRSERIHQPPRRMDL